MNEGSTCTGSKPDVEIGSGTQDGLLLIVGMIDAP